jgi:hypothetical protein
VAVSVDLKYRHKKPLKDIERVGVLGVQIETNLLVKGPAVDLLKDKDSDELECGGVYCASDQDLLDDPDRKVRLGNPESGSANLVRRHIHPRDRCLELAHDASLKQMELEIHQQGADKQDSQRILVHAKRYDARRRQGDSDVKNQDNELENYHYPLKIGIFQVCIRLE